MRCLIAIAACVALASYAAAEDLIDRTQLEKAATAFRDTERDKLTAVRDRIVSDKLTQADITLLRDDLPADRAKKTLTATERTRLLAAKKKLIEKLDARIAGLDKGEWFGHFYTLEELEVGSIGPFPSFDVAKITKDQALVFVRLSQSIPVVRGQQVSIESRSSSSLQCVLRGFAHQKWVDGKSYRLDGMVIVSGIEVDRGQRRLIVEPLSAYWPIKETSKK